MGLFISLVEVQEKITEDSDYFSLYWNPQLNKFWDYSFIDKQGYFDIQTPLKNRGYNPDKMLIQGTDFETYFLCEHEDTGERVRIDNPQSYFVDERFIIGEEISFQQKGANKLFYEEEMWDTCVVDLDTLYSHWQRYFSKKTPDSEGDGHGDTVEIDISEEEMSRRFKENIVDKFVEGKTFVLYC